MEYLFIYCLQLFEMLSYFKAYLFVALCIGFLVYLFCNLIYLSDKNYNKEMKEPLDFIKKVLCAFLVVFLLIVFIPTKNTLLLMGGMYLGKKAINTVITDEKIKKIDTIINLELDKRIKELKQEGCTECQK